MPWWGWILVGLAAGDAAYLVTPGFGFWDMGWDVFGPFALIIAPVVYVIMAPVALVRFVRGVDSREPEDMLESLNDGETFES